MSSKQKSGGRFFSEDSSSIRIQPKSVLIISLIYIGLVVLLHIYAKLGAPAKVQEEGIPKPQQEQEGQTEEAL